MWNAGVVRSMRFADHTVDLLSYDPVIHPLLVDSHGWTMQTVADQWFQFVSPSGQLIDSQRHRQPRPPDRPAAPA